MAWNFARTMRKNGYSSMFVSNIIKKQNCDYMICWYDSTACVYFKRVCKQGLNV